jgi:DNA-binding ferritin-like protein
MSDFDFTGSYGLKLKRRLMDVEKDTVNSVDEETADLADEIMMAAVSFHKLHLKVKDLGSYAAHKALNDLYDALPGHADNLVEGYQGAAERIIKCEDENYTLKTLNTVEEAVSYIRELNSKVCELQGMMPYSEIVNDLDTLKSTLNSAKYKLLFLK